MSSNPLVPVQPTSYADVSHIPADVHVNREGECGICLASMADPVLEAQARAQCTECEQTIYGTPVSRLSTAVVVHPGALGNDRYHLHCLLQNLITTLRTPSCPQCYHPIDSSALLTRTETESSQFIQSAQRSIETITLFVGGTKQRVARAVAEMNRGRSNAIVRTEAYLSGFGAMATLGGGVYTGCRILSNIWAGVFPVTGGEGLIVTIGLIAGYLISERWGKPPIDSAEYTIYPNASAMPPNRGIMKGIMEAGNCILCDTPLQVRVQHVPAARCEGSLTTHEGGAICDAAVVIRKAATRVTPLHLHCTRRRLHRQLLTGVYEPAYAFNKSIGKRLLTTAEKEIVDRLYPLQNQQTLDERVEKYTPAILKTWAAFGLSMILWSGACALSRREVTLWNAAADMGSLAMYVGFGLSSLTFSWLGRDTVHYFRY